ncbi:MAG TPA: zinc-dependent metalloprotease family protein [Blastocatellia bacterium]|nr:zinc-dependent metalloprotease family protein [Blastocatellia bacterium]
MRENKPDRFTFEKSQVRRGRNGVHRIIVITATLLILGAGVALSFGEILRAAGPPRQGESPDRIWRYIDENSIAAKGNREVIPSAYRTVRLDMDELKSALARVPIEFTEAAKDRPFEITMPMPDGGFSRFHIVDSPMLEEKTAAQFPEIKNYCGQGIDEPAAVMRCDLTIDGFHAMILSSRGAIFIGPYAPGDTTHYISYFVRDDTARGAQACFATNEIGGRPHSAQVSQPQDQINQAELRTYFLAAAATAEYTNQAGIRQPGDTDAMAQERAMGDINTTMMAVNAVYQRDLAVRLTVISSTAIIFTNPANDGYTSGNTGMLINENQGILDLVIGPANYDIGHVFDVGNAGGGGGGQGELGVVCQAGQKGKGTTGGRTNSVLAAHEMGHQFGATHTFNANNFGACAQLNGTPQRTATSAYEPAAGSSIMSYSGTCSDASGTANLQGYRDMFFNASSLIQIIQYTTNGAGSACPVVTNTGNNGLSMSLSRVVTVPAQTPFRLFVLAEDIDPGTGNNETVSWEEYDLGDPSPPEGDDGHRPIFRVYPPVASPTRDFPRLDYILNNGNNPPATYQGALNFIGGQIVICAFDAAGNPIGTCLTGETLPVAERSGDNAMVFQAVARDNDVRGGAINIVTMRVHIIAGNPFQITTPSNLVPTTWIQGTRQQVRWDTANTENPPVDCDSVKITLSVDGGQTFPIVLAANTPNDGSETVALPEDLPLVNNARLKIESIIPGNSHHFFDISNLNITTNRLAVTTTADSGEGSLRKAILDANSDPNLTRIPFDVHEGFLVQTINILSELPVITSPVIIDGWSQGGEGYSGPPLIQLNGASADPGPGFMTNGLTLSGGNSTIQGLIINRFSGSGIDFRTNGGNKVIGCYIGTNATGTATLGNAGPGITINNTPGNEIGRVIPFAENIISGNNVGILITGNSATGNRVMNNYIGTNSAGADLGNTLDGVRIDGAAGNLIGGTRNDGGFELPTPNVISGNGAGGGGADGIEIIGPSASGNMIQGNLIGLAANGNTALGNLGAGIRIENSPLTKIGGATGALRNSIAGNGNQGGIALVGAGASNTTIQGNYIGTNAAGDTAVFNNAYGIYVESGNNTIGGGATDAGNLIVNGIGIYVAFGGTAGTTIQGNKIGTNAAGTAALNSTNTGIEVRSTTNILIGGANPGERNIISGNFTGMNVVSSSNVRVLGNHIGTNPAGTAALPNVRGVFVDGGANNRIGGDTPGAGNVISANGTGGNDHGISLANTNGAIVQGNRIGTNAAGTAAMGNGGHGVQVFNSTNCTIGGPTAAARNIISANGFNGILITSSNNTTVQNNYIGTDITGTANLGNGLQTGESGVVISFANNNTIGGAGVGNIIANSGCFCFGQNRGNGILIFSGTGNRIEGNSIFGNAELGIDLSGGAEGANRVTPNDNCDVDAGPNNLQNYPLLSAAINGTGIVRVEGTLNATASLSYTLHFYANPACDAAGNGEGRSYLGSASVVTAANCIADFTGENGITLAGVTVPAGQIVTATATSDSGNTSEFSACVVVTGVCGAISPSSQTFTHVGGNGKVNVAAGAGCNWTAASNDSWIIITSENGGTGAGVVTFEVRENPGGERTGTISIAEQVFTVTQLGSCIYSISPTLASHPAAGGNGSINVTTANNCIRAGLSNANWITITSPNGTGSGAVTYSVSPNNGPARTGTITVGGKIFTVKQKPG